MQLRGNEYGIKVIGGTEEEKAGLVRGDSRLNIGINKGITKDKNFIAEKEFKNSNNKSEK